MRASAKEANDDPRRRDEEKKLRRLVIADSDLWQAYRFLELLLEYECQDLETEDNRRCRDLVIALDIALVVAYCRPFLQSKGGRRKNTALQLQGRLLRAYSDDEKKLHLAILEQRNSEFAHSDADSYSPTISKTPFGLMPIMRNPFPFVDFGRAKRLRNMIAKMFQAIRAEKEKLSRDLPTGSTLYS